MTRGTIYLAGPIANTNAGDAFEWRDEIAYTLGDMDYTILNPLRGKDKLRKVDIGDNMRQYERLGSFYEPAGIMHRDHFDVCRADLLFVNLLGAGPSFGTAMELAWAYHMQKPCVVAIEEKGNLHAAHPMIAQCLTFRATSLDEAVDMVGMVMGYKV